MVRWQRLYYELSNLTPTLTCISAATRFSEQNHILINKFDLLFSFFLGSLST